MENDTGSHAGCVDSQTPVAGCGEAIGQQVVTELELEGKPGDARGAPTHASESQDKTTTPPQTLREFERALRSIGYTRAQAEHIGRRGFAGINAPDSTEQADSDQLHHALQKLVHAMKA